jgi:hypothetical protein
MVMYADVLFLKNFFTPIFLNYSHINYSFFLSHRCMIRGLQGIQVVREVYPLSVINSAEVLFCFIFYILCFVCFYSFSYMFLYVVVVLYSAIDLPI